MPTSPAPTPASDITFDGGSLVVTSGLHDTEDGISLRVAGDAYARTRITPQGAIRQGVGDAEPVSGARDFALSEVAEDVYSSLSVLSPYPVVNFIPNPEDENASAVYTPISSGTAPAPLGQAYRIAFAGFDNVPSAVALAGAADQALIDLLDADLYIGEPVTAADVAAGTVIDVFTPGGDAANWRAVRIATPIP